MREALINAYAHANASSIRAEDSYLTRELRLIVVDEPESLGVPGMRERAQKLGAHFNVCRQQGSGTEADSKVLAKNRTSGWPGPKLAGTFHSF